MSDDRLRYIHETACNYDLKWGLAFEIINEAVRARAEVDEWKRRYAELDAKERVATHECARARAAEAELGVRLANACDAIDTCHAEYADLERACGDWSERCAQLEAEQKAAVRLVGEWAARAGAMEARCESREGALRECHALAETGDCGAIAIAVEAALGEVTP